MTELTVASEIGKPNSPPPVAQPASEFQRDATIVSEWSTAGVLSVVVGKSLHNAVRPAGYKVYLDELLKASGAPTDPLEKMLVEQITVAHHRILALHAQAAQAESPEMIEVLNAAATKLAAEMRRLCLALREYRSPITPKNVTVVKQQNLAAGDQQIALVDKSSSGSTQKISKRSAVSTNQKKAITHEVTPTFDAAILGRNRAPIESV